MTRSLSLFGSLFGTFFIFTANINIHAQEVSHGHNGMINRRALVLDIDTRVLDSSVPEEKQVIVWNETHRRMAIPGSPVGVKLVGSNVVVVLQFTPFIRRQNQDVLVAQGQIWIDDPEKGICYYTSIQTIPMELGEPIFFFPLGNAQELDAFIEIMITVKLYGESVINTPENE